MATTTADPTKQRKHTLIFACRFCFASSGFWYFQEASDGDASTCTDVDQHVYGVRHCSVYEPMNMIIIIPLYIIVLYISIKQSIVFVRRVEQLWNYYFFLRVIRACWIWMQFALSNP